MKNHKIYLLLLLISLCLILLCSCRCNPAECQWYLLEMTDDLSFANGVTEFGEITIYDGAHFWYKGQSYVAVGENNFAFLFCE